MAIRIKGFTLYELMIVIGVLVVLSTLLVFLLNPFELLNKSKDSRRIMDVTSLNDAIIISKAADLSLNLGSPNTVYVSLSSASFDCSGLGLPALEIGQSYRCSSVDNYLKTDGTGWVPVDLSSTLSVLPVDPENSTSSGKYYTYLPTGASGYELTAPIISQKYRENLGQSFYLIDGDNVTSTPGTLLSRAEPSGPVTGNLLTVLSGDHYAETLDAVVGSDGLPTVFLFADSILPSIFSIKCGNQQCSSGNLITLARSFAPSDYITHIAADLGSDGFPILAFKNGSSLQFIKCGNSSCSENQLLNITTGSIGSIVSVAVGSDGLPLISFAKDGRVKTAKCFDLSCSSSGIYSVIDGINPSIAIGSGGIPIISFAQSSLYAVKCGNADCSVSPTDPAFLIDNSLAVSGESEIKILDPSVSGLPVIAYNGVPGEKLKLAKCDNSNCSLSNSTILEQNFGGRKISLAIGSDKLPTISHIDGTYNRVRVVKCGNDSCSSGNIFSDFTSSGLDYPLDDAIVIGADGLPLIFFSTEASEILAVKCSTISCQQ